MTDEELKQALIALAGQHLRYPRTPADELRSRLDQIAYAYRLLKIVRDSEDTDLLHKLVRGLDNWPVRYAVDEMEASGILDALDDAPDIVLGELRRSAIPKEDEVFLRNAGFDDNEIELLLTIAVKRAHALALSGTLPSVIADEAVQTLETARIGLESSLDVLPARKKRKTWAGIGKLLGGAAAGIGNVLLLTGTIAAPNPATGYAAIASGGLAVSSFFAGIGDLKGE